MPVGNAGNITAYWKGYTEYLQAEKSPNRPVMLGFQAAGSAPIVLGHPVDNPQTFATAIRIGNPASWESAVAARDESGGLIEAVTDDEIRDAYIAGLIKLSDAGYFDDKTPAYSDKIRVTCILTGHGLKDPDNAIKSAEAPLTVENDEDAILDAIGLEAEEELAV